MMKKYFAAVLVMGVCAVCVQASEIMTSARQLGFGRVSGVVYGVNSKKEVDFGEFSKYDYSTVGYGAKLTVKVLGGWHVYAKGGKFSPELKLQTGSQDKFENKDNYQGSFIGGGVKWVMFPDTIVTPAVALDLGVTKSSSDLNKVNGVPVLSQNWDINALEYQGAVSISKKLLMFDPYGGVKFFKTAVDWRTTVDEAGNLVDKKISGDANGVAPYIGLSWSILPFVALTAEGSFGAEQSFAGGLTVGF
jgi:hypothetical protein